jgi:hypothetical protein
MRPFKYTLGLVLLIGFLTAEAETAAAQGNGKLIFEDKFQALDPAWGFDENVPNRSNGPDGLVYTWDPGNEVVLLNQSELYDNYEVCAVFATKVPAEAGAWCGVAFWGSDGKNLYEVDVFPALGRYAVSRIQNDKLLTPVSATSSDSIHKGTNVTNEISVIVRANKATLAVNGKKVVDFSGRPPEGGSLFGFTLGTNPKDTGPSTITLKSIQLREVEAEPQSSQTGQQPSAATAQPATSGQPQPSTATPQPQSTPSVSSEQPTQPQPNAAATEAPAPQAEAPSPPAKPEGPAIGFTVTLGIPLDAVKKAYPAATAASADILAMPGIKFFFKNEDKVLYEIMVEPPYEGDIDGIKIGDSADDIVARRGKPEMITPVFGGSGYLYHVSGFILRYDVDEKSKKVTAIVQILPIPDRK